MTFRASALCALAVFFAVSCSYDANDVELVSLADGGIMSFNMENGSWINEQTNKSKPVYSKIGKLETNTDSALYMRSVTEEMPEPELSGTSRTRATFVTASNMYNSIQVSAYKYTGSWTTSLTPTFFHNKTFGPNSTNPYYGSAGSTEKYKWPGSGVNLKFFAYTPKFDDVSLTVSPETQPEIKLEFKTPRNISDQRDLLVAVSDEVPGDYSHPVSLRFKHVLTGLRFVARGLKPGYIKKISLTKLFSDRTYNMTAQRWESYTRSELRAAFTNEFVLLKDIEITGELDQIINPDDIFFFPPQFLPANNSTQLTIVYQENGKEERVLTTPSKDQLELKTFRHYVPEFKEGHIVTFYISSKSNSLALASELNDFSPGEDL